MARARRTVRRLEQAGFVRRRPSPTDRRASLIEPTAASHALRREVERDRSRLEDLSATGLSDDERANALATLERLEHNLVRAGAQPMEPHGTPEPARHSLIGTRAPDRHTGADRRQPPCRNRDHPAGVGWRSPTAVRGD
ncbi:MULTISPECIES: MarR family winged helix-turn-helix transcriptional regulator [unclassified Streptomyces]|uniref:MarR family winged helix-turn-helix transcriptional regulator n=1 Tax=unclassified Streptomyces TaxID=2593676 RepID=UPI0038667A2A